MFNRFKPKVSMQWLTPNGDQLIADIARVSVHDNEGKNAEKLIRHMQQQGHSSPFDMVNMCIEVHAPRDISRQILRHWSIHPQEFSQRYSVVSNDMFVTREARRQHQKNRQMSVPMTKSHDDETLMAWWDEMQQQHIANTVDLYEKALSRGIAKECARVVLPEGNTMSRLFLNGTVRSWIYYLKSRCDIDATQREHVAVADKIMELFATAFPIVHAAFFRPPEYELIHALSRVSVCNARSEADVHRWAVSTWGEDKRIVVSFQPGDGTCRINVKSPDETMMWYDYLLITTGE